MRFRVKLSTVMWLVAGAALTLAAFSLVHREHTRLRMIIKYQAQSRLFRAERAEQASAQRAAQLLTLGAENAVLRARVAELERKLGLTAPPAGGGPNP